jgi:p-aminobenzoyl-glutamate transporter AbgT
MPKPLFTSETGKAAARLATLARKKQLKFERTLEKNKLTLGLLTELGDVLKIFVATPVGQIITGLLGINFLEQTGLLASVDALHAKEVFLTAEVLGALGGSGVIPQVASMFSSFATKPGATPA